MYIEEITIKNFRNLDNIRFTPHNGINLILGNNAQGKTNILESIYVVANLKSFRGKKLSETIAHGYEKSKININLNKNKVSNSLIFEIEKDIKNILLNNKRPSKINEYLGFLDTVLFYPDDIITVKGSPSLRRNLIDRAIFQTDNNYLNLVQNYFKCLKQRNAALKEKKNTSDLWDLQFVELASKINFQRIIYIERINNILGEIFEKIYHCGESVTIKPPDYDDPHKFKQKFAGRLAASRSKERLYGTTLIGPHRDDLQFLLNGKSLSVYGSQGQQRSFMLAFKTAQIIDFKKCRGVRPVLLLDDMTSELDNDRKDSFFASLLDQAGQVFITSTDFTLLKNKRFPAANFLKVENGKIDQYN